MVKGQDEGSSRTALLKDNDDSPRSSLESERETDGLVGTDETSIGKGSVVRAYDKRKSTGSWKVRRPTRFCTIIASIVLIGLIGVIAGSSYFVYKVKPPDGQSPPWYPAPLGGTVKSWEESYKKATVMVNKMSLLEKVNVTTGIGWSSGLCVGDTAPAVEAGFPPLCLMDGPLGIRFADHITAFPAGVTVGATWNKELMYKRGRAHANEARLKGVHVLLGPSMGPLGRMPAGGRNWEGFGPDPVLQGIAAHETIKGIQDEGVMATAKHLVGNEQEHFRQQWEWGIPNAMSSNIDDRTMHELYLWPFAESVRAGVASVMCSYNMVNNSFACGNSKLINGLLKDELGFQGFMQSDWLAQRSGVASALAGLDMSMPGDGMFWANGKSLWGEKLTIAALNGSVPMERINDMAARVVAAWYQLGQDDKGKWPPPPPEGDGGPNFSSWVTTEYGPLYFASNENITGRVNKFVDVQGSGKDFHGRLAKDVAAEGTVLVKNEDNLLPLSKKGFSQDPPNGVKFNVGVFGEDAGSGNGPNFCSDRACNIGTLASGWGSGAVEFPYLVAPIKALQSNYDFDHVNLTEHLVNESPSSSVVSSQDLCLVFVNSDSGEGYVAWEGIKGDRNDIAIQKGGDKLVQAVAKDCGKGKGDVVVVVHAVGPVILEPWIDLPNVKAVMLANLPGQESGNALAAVLFGDVDASGRLPYTIGKSLDDYGPAAQIMYYPRPHPQQYFEEGLYIDYRYFDKQGIAPRYPFGHGLSYTTFDYSDLKLTTIKPKSPLPSPRPAPLQPPSYDTTIPDPESAVLPPGFHKIHKRIYPYIDSVKSAKPGPKPYPYPEGYNITQPPSQASGGEGGNPSLYEPHLSVSVTLRNTGSRRGKEVVQVYVSFPDDVVDEASPNGEGVDFPVRVLRGFEKVELEVEESRVVEVQLTRKDLSYWSVWRQNWVMPEGTFTVSVGRSSRDLKAQREW